MQNITWATPQAFLLFIPFFAAIAWRLWKGRSLQSSLQYSQVEAFKKLPPALRVRLRGLPQAILFLSTGLAILALARPQIPHSKIKRSVDGIDIMLVLDISDSMAIEDMDPLSRIAAAKKVLTEFVEKRPDDRIGLVAFKGEAFTRVPMTLDHDLLLRSIKALDPTSRSMHDGTAIGSALALAVARIKDSTAKSRVIILATDGENNMGTIDPETALEIAKGFALRIYTIGMGKDGESMLPIWTMDAFGRRQKTYQPIHSSVNDELLGKMAKDTGGQYYRATAGGTLEKVFHDIDHLEKNKIESTSFTTYEELFPKFLTAALFLVLVSVVLQNTVFLKFP